eukprot:TRINITY_DN887_c1_g1_i2.p1 TRINITY_DN887_c1_g1~~TRINITY_DN887_c1_g1_i2.p1  ORF type:complete len:117 (-),score=62.18 TRINITY_DN887_c1_g1_i2:313-663(-)
MGGMKYCAAYLMLTLGGKESPSKGDLKEVLGAIGSDFDETLADKLLAELEGKTVHDLIKAGREKLASFGGGGGGPAAGGAAAGGAAAGGGAAPAAKEEKKVVEEEEEEDMEFDLFG